MLACPAPGAATVSGSDESDAGRIYRDEILSGYGRWPGLCQIAAASPLPQITICPTGGITAATAPEWLALPNVRCLGGSWVAPQKLIADGDFATIRNLAKEAAAL